MGQWGWIQPIIVAIIVVMSIISARLSGESKGLKASEALMQSCKQALEHQDTSLREAQRVMTWQSDLIQRIERQRDDALTLLNRTHYQ